MRVVIVRRRVRRKRSNRFLDLARSYSREEKFWDFAIELLLFAVVMVVSALPIIAAADALNRFL